MVPCEDSSSSLSSPQNTARYRSRLKRNRCSLSSLLPVVRRGVGMNFWPRPRSRLAPGGTWWFSGVRSWNARLVTFDRYSLEGVSPKMLIAFSRAESFGSTVQLYLRDMCAAVCCVWFAFQHELGMYTSLAFLHWMGARFWIWYNTG